VLADSTVVGRIMKAAAAPVGAPWLWTQGKVLTQSFADRWLTTLKTALKKRGQLRRSPSTASKPEAVAR
jgi:hypothetical protein